MFHHLVNYNLRNGNFELNIRNREIRFKSHVDCDGLTISTTAMIRNSIYICISIFKRYGDAIYHIIYDDMTPFLRIVTTPVLPKAMRISLMSSMMKFFLPVSC